MELIDLKIGYSHTQPFFIGFLVNNTPDFKLFAIFPYTRLLSLEILMDKLEVTPNNVFLNTTNTSAELCDPHSKKDMAVLGTSIAQLSTGLPDPTCLPLPDPIMVSSAAEVKDVEGDGAELTISKIPASSTTKTTESKEQQCNVHDAPELIAALQPSTYPRACLNYDGTFLAVNAGELKIRGVHLPLRQTMPIDRKDSMHWYHVRNMSWSPKENILLTSSVNGEVLVWGFASPSNELSKKADVSKKGTLL